MKVRVLGVRKLRKMIERRNQVVASWARTHEFQSSFFHEKTKHVILEEEETHDRTGQPVVCPQRGARPQQFIGDDEAELELSLRSRSFLDRVNDQEKEKTNTIFDECYRKRRKTFECSCL